MDKIRKEDILVQLRILKDIPVLDAYCGLYKVCIKNDKDPEACIHITNAKHMLFSTDTFSIIKDSINKLNELLNE